MTTISGINSSYSTSSVAGMYPPPPPMERGQKLSDEQKTQLAEILSNYDAEDMTEEDMKSMLDEIKEAGITPGKELKETLEEAGFELKPPQQGQGGPPPMGGMNGPMGGAEPPQFAKDFMDKVQSGELTEDDITTFLEQVEAQKQSLLGMTGLMVDTQY